MLRVDPEPSQLALNPAIALQVGFSRPSRGTRSGLNQVELWLNKVEREDIASRIFTSQADLRRKLMRHIREHNKVATPIKWKHTDLNHRIRADHSAVTVH